MALDPARHDLASSPEKFFVSCEEYSMLSAGRIFSSAHSLGLLFKSKTVLVHFSHADGPFSWEITF